MIKRIYLILSICLGSIINLSAQDEIFYYRASGERIIDTPMSINDFVYKYFDSELRYYPVFTNIDNKRLQADFGIEVICFKDLTTTPYGLITSKKLSAETIVTVLKKFKSKDFYNSQRFYENVDRAIEGRRLTSSYLRQNLGSPNKIIPSNDAEDTKWIYDSLRLTLYFVDSVVVGFKSKNYKGNVKKVNNLSGGYHYYSTPVNQYYALSKVVEERDVYYRLQLVGNDDIDYRYNPIKIILENGRIIVKEEEAKVSSVESLPYGNFYLTQIEASLLATYLITDFTLGDSHTVMPTENATDLREYFKVLLSLK
ncbi:MAG TPA: hypothetical protein PLS87_11215 [Ferruginibacter sp.]|nr:hypothetical protein [Ferruginibacter sp.]HRP50452.1 hypothetical protein [Ferruginibacter sp.]